MATTKHILLLFLLFNAFNVGYNLKCYSCETKHCTLKVVKCNLCPPTLNCDHVITRIIFHKDHCVSRKYRLDGEEYTFRGCGSDLQKVYSKLSNSFYSECKDDLCNGIKNHRSSYYKNNKSNYTLKIASSHSSASILKTKILTVIITGVVLVFNVFVQL